MASIKVKFRPSSAADREGTIYYQIIHVRSLRLLLTDYHVYPCEWDNKSSMVVISSDSTRRSVTLSMRDSIRQDIRRLTRIIRQLDDSGLSFSTDDIITEFRRQSHEYTLFNFMSAIIVRLKKNGKLRTSETYTSALSSFRNFRCNNDIMLDCLNSDVMEAYQAWHQQKGNTRNTISFYNRILRAVYYRAVENGMTDDRHPFRHVYTGVDKTVKKALPIQTIRKIKHLDLSNQPTLDHARDIFMLSFMLRGMSFIDMAYLKKSDLRNGQVTYRRRKTGQLLTVKWRPEMQAILNKYKPDNSPYLLPILTSSTNSTYNQYRSKQYLVNTGLKTVAQHIGLKMPLTLYCSRHSWASIAKAKGIPVGVISDGLGHDSEQTTQIYLSTLDTSAVDNANALIIASL